MDREDWSATVHGVSKSWTGLSDWLHIPGCLALGEWSHHCDSLGHEDLFFVQFFCVFWAPVLNIFCLCKVHTISVLFQAHLPLISLIFLKRSLVFPILLFSSISLHWLLRKVFLFLLAILWNSAFRCLYLSFSSLLFTSLLFTAICKASSDRHFAFFHFVSMGMVLIPVSCTMSWTSVHSSSGTLSIRLCQQIWKTEQWPQDWKRSVFIPIPKRQCQRILKIPHNCLISH